MTIVRNPDIIDIQAGSEGLGWLSVFYRVRDMNRRLEKLMDEKRSLKTQLVQIQSMLFTIDFYISEELLQQVQIEDRQREE